MRWAASSSGLLCAVCGLAAGESSCSHWWSCGHAGANASKFYRGVYPGVRVGGCAAGSRGLSFRKDWRWPEACAREFAALLVDGGPSVRGPARECVNLAPAGGGTKTVTEALRAAGLPECGSTPRGGCAHHEHELYGARDAAARGARCVVATVREPAARLESGFRYLVQREKIANAAGKRINDVVAAWARDYDRRRQMRPLLGVFGVPLAAFFAGVERADLDVRLVCTDRLGADLAASGFPADANATAHRRSAHATADLRNRSTLAPQWRTFLNAVVYAADYAVYARRCLGGESS